MEVYPPHTEFSLESADRQRLWIREWSPENKPHAIVLMIHGIGEHGGRYQDWARRFNNEGYSFIAIDYRGHGKADGKRGDTKSYKRFLDDVDCLIHYAREKFPDVPKILYGHSMGANIVLWHSIYRKGNYKLVIASSPWLRLAVHPPLLRLALGRVLSFIAPSMVQSTGLIAAHLSHDADEVKRYLEDNLVHDRISVHTFFSVGTKGLKLMTRAPKMEVPCLLIHGKGDKITDWKGSAQFAKRQPAVTLKLWDEMYHELHNEICRDEVFATIKQFITERLWNGELKSPTQKV